MISLNQSEIKNVKGIKSERERERFELESSSIQFNIYAGTVVYHLIWCGMEKDSQAPAVFTFNSSTVIYFPLCCSAFQKYSVNILSLTNEICIIWLS